jgi:hypothetical protein
MFHWPLYGALEFMIRVFVSAALAVGGLALLLGLVADWLSTRRR